MHFALYIYYYSQQSLFIANYVYPSHIHLYEHCLRLTFYIYYLYCLLLIASYMHLGPIYLYCAQLLLYIYIIFCLLLVATYN